MWDKKRLENLVLKSTSYRGLAKLMGLRANHKKAQQLVLKFKIDTSHFMFGKRYQSWVNKTCNQLTILKVWSDPNGHRRWFCDCSCSCGDLVFNKRLDSIITGRVVSCGCYGRSKPTILAGGNGSFRGCGELRSAKLFEIKRGAERRNIAFEVTKEYLWGLFEKQGGKCAMTGEPIKFGRVYFPHETTASLDRVDSSKGYIEGNLQWVLKDVNKVKRDLDQDYFVRICTMVASHAQGLKLLPGRS